MSLAEETRDNLVRAYPKDSFQVIMADNFCVSEFRGHVLLRSDTAQGDYLLILRVHPSCGPPLTDAQVFECAFPHVYATRAELHIESRRDLIKARVSECLPQHTVLVLGFKADHDWAAPFAGGKGSAVFSEVYGSHDIVIVVF